MAKEKEIKLTDEDKNNAAIIAQLLKRRVGEKNVIASGEICDKFAELDHPINGQKFRQIINYLRNRHGYPIVSNNKGYFWAASKAELQACYNSLKERIQSQVNTLNTIQKTIERWKEPSK